MSLDYKSADDKTLTQAVKENNTEAFSELYVRYLRLIRAKAALLISPSLPDSEDLCQEGLWALYAAACSFDPDMSASFRTYAQKCIFNAMVSALRRHGGKKSIPLDNHLPLDSAEGLYDSGAETLELQIEGKFDFGIILKKIKAKLSPMEYEVFSLYLRGYKRQEISQRLQITLKSFDNAMNRVRSKLRKL